MDGDGEDGEEVKVDQDEEVKEAQKVAVGSSLIVEDDMRALMRDCS